ncbi:MAG: cyclic nucleotide-binding domain-containing protein [Alphaproteobacteria bacterium]|nr:cyclic nucleotide-binding domain-containing protein [Alphaproteobacteria bacterium]
MKRPAVLEDLQAHEVAWLRDHARQVHLDAGEVLFEQGAQARSLFLVLEGELEVWREHGGTRMRVATAGPDEVIGELAFLDDQPRSATVQATTPSRLAELQAADLERAPEGSLLPRVLAAAARAHAERLRRANDLGIETLKAQLQESEDKRRLSVLLVTVISLSSAYSYALGLLQHVRGAPLLLASLAVAVGAAVGAALFIRASGHPRARFGLTLEGSWAACRAALLWAAVAVPLATALKALGLALVPAWAGLPLLAAPPPLQLPLLLGAALAYLLSALVQEFAARSFLHSAFELLLPGPRAGLAALLLSNLVFSTFHHHYNLGFSLLTFFGGLVFGAYWRRHPNLLGVSLLHWIVGSWVMDGLGLFTLPGFAL